MERWKDEGEREERLRGKEMVMKERGNGGWVAGGGGYKKALNVFCGDFIETFPLSTGYQSLLSIPTR